MKFKVWLVFTSNKPTFLALPNIIFKPSLSLFNIAVISDTDISKILVGNTLVVVKIYVLNKVNPCQYDLKHLSFKHVYPMEQNHYLCLKNIE